MHIHLKFWTLCFPIIIALALISCEQDRKVVEIQGIYGNPKALWDKGLTLNELGINSIFVHSGSINQEMIDKAKSEGAKVFAEFATLNGKNYVEKHPEAWAINEKGNKIEAATWFMGVCPTEPEFRKYRFAQLRELLVNFDLDGVWMDYVHWHAQFEDPKPILPETCFCDHCLANFSQSTGLEIPGKNTSESAAWILNNHEEMWRKWRCKVIFDWTVEIKQIVKEIRPKALLGLYHCPWNDQDFDGARRRILGLDYDLLQETVDVFSPMVYHARMGRNPEWVEENIEWFCNRLDIGNDSYPKVWPIVQAHDDPGIISAGEFEKVLEGGLSSKSTGVMMFTTNDIAKSTEKTEVLKKIYLNK
ncbi:family 10 glycosylhydrolase [Reichenbachiella sp. MALMAid0571]|uniref:family 10 glycosylhydrolase n=1 Tax=Reichenbachiella sp. MALMAid0571 TaxID=3143939 RepID=UPI0032DEA7BB